MEAYPRRLVHKTRCNTWRSPGSCVACGCAYGLPRPACELGACLACGSIVCHSGLRDSCPVCLIGKLFSGRTIEKTCALCDQIAVLVGRGGKRLCGAHAAVRIYQNASGQRPRLTALKFVRGNLARYREDFIEVGTLPPPEWCLRISQQTALRKDEHK